MTAVFNTSPLIFLGRLGYLEKTLSLFQMVAIPKKVIKEISVKDDEANEKVLKIKNHSNVNFGLATKLVKLYKALNERLGQGESEAIALAVELNADVVILDDFAARKAAMELGLKVKGTLGIIKKLLEENKIKIEDINKLYETLKKIGFRVRREIFKNIFESSVSTCN
ncbi:hypothetical protein HS1_001632 [Candidatus Desulfofervidus auxilii]|uniref:DUF3368 domain-containing protein n=1 Tax=Desulfofervidus auxilii TaxID=1621989 RepID=A0A7U4QL84_DESA2|nr:DUF3368 domain-containing protein [Candidatus Desulfofervidus auxilii]AMM41426.1 hypothetical protein HS1_001632 [Candidatus Desulfofervidus auxilii]